MRPKMQGAVERNRRALETLEVLIITDQLPIGAPEGFAGADEALLERLGGPHCLTDQIQDSRRDRSVGSSYEPAEMRSGIVDAGSAQLGVEVATEGLRIRYRGQHRLGHVIGQTELREMAVTRLDVDIALL